MNIDSYKIRPGNGFLQNHVERRMEGTHRQQMIYKQQRCVRDVHRPHLG